MALYLLMMFVDPVLASSLSATEHLLAPYVRTGHGFRILWRIGWLI
jgi:hypothetical protein